LLGSNTGNNNSWSLVDLRTISSIDYWQPYFDNKVPSNFNVLPTKTFSYYRVVINSTYGRAGYSAVAQLNLYSNDETMNSDFQNFLANTQTYAYFRATDLIEDTGKIPAKIGGFVADTNGVTLDNGDGHRAIASIPFLYGDINSSINFNAKINKNFTVCSITRYTGTTRKRILCATQSNWLHGHHGNRVGVAYYNKTINLTNLPNTLFDDWVVTCGKNGSQPDRNLIANGINRGEQSGGSGTGNATICINDGSYNEKSNFAFSQLLIWDKVLTDNEMQDVSNYLLKYLEDGLD
jgi:hypothetical protein